MMAQSMAVDSVRMAVSKPTTRRLIAAAVQVRWYSAPSDRSIPLAKRKYVPTSGTYPKGFLAGSAFAGVKASNTKYDDLALVVSEKPCAANAVFTQNKFKAAPVSASQRILANRKGDQIRGVVVNSGCANAVTGQLGKDNAEIMARVTDSCFTNDGASKSEQEPQSIVMSTGVIGQQLPIDRITAAIPKLHASLGSSHEHWLGAAQAICTTDTFPKLLSRTFTLPSHPDTTYSIAGMTKGAGMIHPNMATLLGIVCTDVNIHPSAIKSYLQSSTSRSFNCISIDGDTSTNDTVALLANGAAAPSNAKPLTWTDSAGKALSDDAAAFYTVLETFMADLAKLVVRDGEGATKFVTIRAFSDCGYTTAKRVANSIARSSLVKTALYGKDANWGRILCAIGYAPGVMDTTEVPVGGEAEHQVVPEHTSVSFVPADGSEEMKLLVRGEPQAVDEVRAKEILEMEDLEIRVRLEDGKAGEGKGQQATEAVVWTCDLSHEYVTINGDYRT